MAVEASQLAMIHIALNEIVPLHAIFVCREVSILIKIGSPGLKLFQLPVIGQPFTGQEAYRPIEVLVRDWIVERPSLAVALDTDIVAANVVEGLGVDDVISRWMFNMQAARPMALFAANIPFGNLFCLHVVIDGVTSVAGRAGWPIEVCRAVERNPPIRAGLHVISKPSALRYVPLRWKRVVVLA